MNKEVIIIGGGVLGGMVSNGASTLLPESLQENVIVNVALAGVSIFGATKVTGISTKDNMLKGALIGSAIVQGLKAVQKIGNKHIAPKLTSNTKVSRFAKGAIGLGSPDVETGLNAQFMGADGEVYQVDESGLNGMFMDEAGQVFEMEENAGLNGTYMDEAGNVFEMDEAGNVFTTSQAQLNGAVQQELYPNNGLNDANLLEQIY